MAPDSEQQRLWIRALEDAGLDATAAVLVITTTPPSTRSGAAAGWFAPRATLQSPPLPLTDSEQSELADVGERHRVAVFGDAKPEIQLGMMRWCLEHVTQFDMNEQIPEFVGAINEALHGKAEGAGGAVVWHSIPSVDDADLAAGHLVTRVFGPQLGELNGENGVLFRDDRPKGDTTTLSGRMVVFAAIFAEEFDDSMLPRFDPSAVQWWKALLDDDDFTHLRKSSKYYAPSHDAIQELMPGNPAGAWRRLQHHLRLCLGRGLAVIEERPPLT